MRYLFVVAILAAALPAGALEADKDTVALWHLSEGKGDTAADALAADAPLRVQGARWTVGQEGYGLWFDGARSFAAVVSPERLALCKGATIEAWVKLDAADGDVVCRNLAYMLRIGGTVKAYFAVDGRWRILEGKRAVLTGRWAHVAITYDVATRTLATWVNGERDASLVLSGLGQYDLDPGSPEIRIGSNTWSTVSGFVKGKIDEVRISSVARTFAPLAVETVAVPAGRNLLRNGEFEFGLEGWRSDGESALRTHWAVAESGAAAGRACLASRIEGKAGVFSLPVRIERGARYELSCAVKARIGAGERPLAAGAPAATGGPVPAGAPAGVGARAATGTPLPAGSPVPAGAPAGAGGPVAADGSAAAGALTAAAAAQKMPVRLRLEGCRLGHTAGRPSLGRSFAAAGEWSRVGWQFTVPADWPTTWATVVLDKAGDGTLWVDGVRLVRDPPAATPPDPGDLVGVRAETGRVGDTLFRGEKANLRAQVVNAGALPLRLALDWQVLDVAGRPVGKATSLPALDVPAGGARPFPMRVPTDRCGAFRVRFTTATDGAGGSGARTENTLRYCVIQDLRPARQQWDAPWGMNTHMERESDAHLDQNLAMLAACGVRWIRGWWGWGMAEKEPGQYDWTEYERQLALCEKHNLCLMPILLRYYPNYERAWAGKVEKIQQPPYDVDGAWARFVEATVRRFKGRVRAWECWNEPGWSDIDPAAYAHLLQVTYERAKAADPTCTIVGFAGVPDAYLVDALKAGAGKHMDVVSDHVYGALGNPAVAMPERMATYGKILGEQGLKMPVWDSEQGTGADGEGFLDLSSEEACAGELVQGYVAALAAGVEKYFWFSAQTSPYYGWFVFYGDYVPRPRLIALNALVAALDGARFRERVDLPGAWAYVFEKTGGAVACLWSAAEPVSLPLPRGALASDLYGNPVAPERGRVTLLPGRPLTLRQPGVPAGRLSEGLRAAKTEQPAPFTLSVERTALPNLLCMRLRNLANRDLDALVGLDGVDLVAAGPVADRQVVLPAGGEAEVTFRLAGPLPATRNSVAIRVVTGLTGLTTYRVAAPLQ